MIDKDNSYNSDSIKVLKGLEAVRKRPGMYIGNTDEISGLLHMVYEVVDNSVDEALAGHCTHIEVILYPDGSISVSDNGRGIPVDIHKEEGIPAAEVIMTQLHAGGKFSQDAYKVSGGLHGVGVSVVNALSEWLKLVVWKNNVEYSMEFERGETKVPLHELGPTKKKGTFVQFMPDATIFSKTVFDYDLMCTKFQQLAFLNPGVEIIVRDIRDAAPVENVFFDRGGVLSFAKYLCKNKTIINNTPLLIRGEQNEIVVDCCILWTTSYSENSLFFTNTIPQADGGTHVAGLRSGLTKSFTKYIQEKGTKAQQKVEFNGDDVREGMVCVLSVKLHDPKFSSQTKEKLVSSNVRQVVENLTSKLAESWLEENPADSSKVLQKVFDSANSREAARRARELSRKNKGTNQALLQVSKNLAACSENDPKKCELFIVEGQSAGGSAKQARNRFFQAVLPLRGKILNIEKANMARALGSEVITTLIAAIGTGIGDEFNINKLRYHKIIIMTDADVDGSHIRVLLLSFFFRYMRPLVEEGHIYLAEPPLYGITYKNNTDYVRDEKQFRKYILQRGSKNLEIRNENAEILASEQEIQTFLQSFANIDEALKNYSPIYKYAVSAKMFTSVHNSIDYFVDYLNKHQNGKWFNADGLIKWIENGVEVDYIFDPEHLHREMRYNLIAFEKSWGHLWGDGVLIGSKKVENPFNLFADIMQNGKKGLYIQRFKGLGEMDKKDLEKESMREGCLIQVKLQQAEAASQITSDLLGDDVPVRRKYIEENAPKARIDL